METRDPRKDPVYLDILAKGNAERSVKFVSALGTVVYQDSSRPRCEQRCGKKAWRRWARGAEIKQWGLGKAEIAHEFVEIPISSQNAGQLNVLRNRIARTCGSYYSEGAIATALMELAMAIFEYHAAEDPDLRLSDLCERLERNAQKESK